LFGCSLQIKRKGTRKALCICACACFASRWTRKTCIVGRIPIITVCTNVSTYFSLGIQKEPVDARQAFFAGRARTSFTSRVTVCAFRSREQGNELCGFAVRIALIGRRLIEKRRVAREAIRAAAFIASRTNWITSRALIVEGISELAIRTS